MAATHANSLSRFPSTSNSLPTNYPAVSRTPQPKDNTPGSAPSLSHTHNKSSLPACSSTFDTYLSVGMPALPTHTQELVCRPPACLPTTRPSLEQSANQDPKTTSQLQRTTVCCQPNVNQTTAINTDRYTLSATPTTDTANT